MKKFSLKKTGSLFITTSKKWFDRDPFREGAIIAYNAIFALPGLLVVVISLAGYFFGAEAVSGQLHRQIAQAMGVSTADSIQQMVIMSMRIRTSLLTTIIGIGTIIFGATAVFVELQKTLNIIWEVNATSAKSGIWAILKTRLFSFGLILSIAFLLLISLVLSSLLSALGIWIQQYWSESLLLFFKLFNAVLSIGIITILFGLMFKIIPDAKIKWNSVWLGAFITSLLFVIGKTALGIYFGTANPGSLYGAAGSIILILLWTSYSSMILFFGAEFTKVYSDMYFGDIPADENAVKDKGRVK
ncbi:MAG: YihY/virulence factor BrkB family protein [Paludibacter sp.]|nr:YihY/virulence factor BrkB family protein [Paludibacter sp.]